MSNYDLLDRVLEKNQGYIATYDAINKGVSKPIFYDYVKERSLLNVAHGLYMEESVWPDDVYIMQFRYAEAIFSHELAAYYHDLSDREPLSMTLTLQAGKSSSRLNKEGIKVYKVKKELFELGLVEIKTNYGNLVRSYDKERTICDIVRSRSNIEVQDLQTILRTYFRSKDKDIPKLMRYAQSFSIAGIMKDYAAMIL